MSFDSSGSFSVTTLVSANGAASLNSDLVENLKYLKGTQSGQTEIQLEALFRPYRRVHENGSSIELRKDWDSGESVAVYEFLAVAQDGGVQTGDTFRLALSGSDGASTMFVIEFERTAESTAKARFIIIDGDGNDVVVMTFLPTGETGILKEPESGFTLDVNGDIDLTGPGAVYSLDGEDLVDWVDDAGTATYTATPGDIELQRLSTTTVGVPIASTGFVQGSNLGATYLDGLTHHSPLSGTGTGTVNGAGISCGSKALNRAGLWEIIATASFFNLPSTQVDITLYLHDGTTQISQDVPISILGSTDGEPCLISANYESAGSETISVLADRDSGTESVGCLTNLVAIWRGKT